VGCEIYWPDKPDRIGQNWTKLDRFLDKTAPKFLATDYRHRSVKALFFGSFIKSIHFLWSRALIHSGGKNSDKTFKTTFSVQEMAVSILFGGKNHPARSVK